MRVSFVKFVYFTALFVFLFQSCSSNKDVLYLNIPPGLSENTISWTDLYIQPNDILSVKITADNAELAAPYNFSIQQNTTGQANALLMQGYLVSNQGTINMPVVGVVKVSGLTINQVELFIQKLLVDKGLLRNPVVICRLVNAKFTVLGEVKAPGTFTFYENNLTLLQALGLAGDLTINGVRKKITIIRTENGKQSYTTIDLTKNDWFKSPYYFVKPNDVIIVDPNTAKVKSSGIIGNPGNLISIVSVLLSSIILIKNL
jgi:polysaccharide export outer membrane protein